jgi:hypothetical protein
MNASRLVTVERAARTARMAGAAYLGTMVFGTLALFFRNGAGIAVNLVATVCYVVVVRLFYVLFKPVNKGTSALAAVFGLAGCAAGALNLFDLYPPSLNPLVFFGVYCSLIAHLIWKSTFLPKFLSLMMAMAGLAWLTFLWPSLARSLTPFNMLPGMIGEGTLTVWLLIKGVDERRWKEQAGA